MSFFGHIQTGKLREILICRFVDYSPRCGGFPGGTTGEEPACQCRRLKSLGFDLWVRKVPWRQTWQPTLVFLPRESHGQRSLVNYSAWGCKESDMTEQACMNTLHTSKVYNLMA